jgi:ABC-type antimicrobial peptide transport system permease subunit
MVLRQGMVLVILGLAVGLAGGVGMTRLLTTFLYGVSPFDVFTWVAGCVALTGVAMAALWLPARRAARVDPLEAIRAE